MNLDPQTLDQQYAPKVTRLYFEAHITVEPLFGAALLRFKQLAEARGFSVADLLMQKRASDTPQRSAKDSFCTGRSQSATALADRAIALVKDLEAAGITVWRYKIEDTLLDSKVEDVFGILPASGINNPLPKTLLVD